MYPRQSVDETQRYIYSIESLSVISPVHVVQLRKVQISLYVVNSVIRGLYVQPHAGVVLCLRKSSQFGLYMRKREGGDPPIVDYQLTVRLKALRWPGIRW